MFFSSGDRAIPFRVAVTASSATLVYTQDLRDREILFQNTDSTYKVYCGTHSAVEATGGPRFILPSYPTALTTNASYSIYCIAESGTIEILGVVERDRRDPYVSP